MPPSIRHLRRPLTAGELHDLPALVSAWQRGALRSSAGSRCMGLSIAFAHPPADYTDLPLAHLRVLIHCAIFVTRAKRISSQNPLEKAKMGRASNFSMAAT